MKTAAANEIVASRTFDAPRELVFSVWTKPEHVQWWYGPRGFQTETQSMDFRPGGEWHFVMRGPDGTEYPNHVIYRVIDPPNRISYSHVEPKFESDIIFEAIGQKTRVTLVMTFDTSQLRDLVAREHGAEEGLRQTLARLVEFADTTAAATATSEPEMIVTRVFDAPRELVFKAHTDPEMMKRWWGPHHAKNLALDIDLRVGGKWSVKQEVLGEIHDFGGNFLEIDPPSRLAITFVWGGAPEDALTSYNSFEDEGGKTRLTSRIVFSSRTMRDRMISQGMAGGMLQSNERLDALLEGVK